MRRAPQVAPVLAVLLSGCGRYADFSLPAPPPGAAPPAFRWQMHNVPVLGRGAPGDWDSVDVLNPSVVAHAGTYWNLYSGFDGHTWHTGLATSADGMSWAKQGRVLS